MKLIDFIKAYNRIKYHINHTPLEQSLYFSKEDRNVFLKLENQQKTKSFKIRGALNKISVLSDEEKQRGILAVSSGNHGIAVSYAAKLIKPEAIMGKNIAVVITSGNINDDYLSCHFD